MSKSHLTALRLEKQQQKLQKEPIKNCVVRRDKDKPLNFHFCIYGMERQYEGGYYHGVLELPPEYPFEPPVLKFFTPSGRFATRTSICTTFTNYHPESWSALWTIHSLIIATISFFQSDDVSTGVVLSDSATKRSLAKASLEWNLNSEQFRRIFPLQLFEDSKRIIALKQELAKKAQKG